MLRAGAVLTPGRCVSSIKVGWGWSDHWGAMEWRFSRCSSRCQMWPLILELACGMKDASLPTRHQRPPSPKRPNSEPWTPSPSVSRSWSSRSGERGPRVGTAWHGVECQGRPILSLACRVEVDAELQNSDQYSKSALTCMPGAFCQASQMFPAAPGFSTTSVPPGPPTAHGRAGPSLNVTDETQTCPLQSRCCKACRPRRPRFRQGPDCKVVSSASA